MLPAPADPPLWPPFSDGTTLAGRKRQVDWHQFPDRQSSFHNTVVEPRCDEAAEAPSAGPGGKLALSLLEDYPDPLTGRQREMIVQHARRCIFRYHGVRKGVRIVERGLHSLQSLLARLEVDRSKQQAALEALNAKATERHPVGSSGDDSVAPLSTSDTGKDAPQPTALEKGPARGGRQRGTLLRSATFANLHSVLTAAKREQNQEQQVSMAVERERISKVTQLKIIEDDIAQQKQNLSLIEGKHKISLGVLETVKREVLEALRLHEEVLQMEVMYPSRFFLRASSAQGADRSEDASSHECYDVFFVPAKYTEEVQDMIREQVEEMLDEYVAFRRRVDAVLEVLAERQRQRQAALTGQLFEVIGVDPKSMGVDTGSGFTFEADALREGNSDTVDVATVGNRIDAVEERSDVENDDEHCDELDDEDELSAEARERKERNEIQTALAALDDFDELY